VRAAAGGPPRPSVAGRLDCSERRVEGLAGGDGLVTLVGVGCVCVLPLVLEWVPRVS